MNLDNIEIVLLGTRHAGNIGSTARAMKNMGISRLTLVKPTERMLVEAIRMSSGAADILEKCRVCETLAEGLAEAAWVVGTTCRVRRLHREVVTAKEAVGLIGPQSVINRVAILFGPENYGLDNDALRRCNSFIHIPTSPGHTSLNLAQSVAILSYELFQATGQREKRGIVRETVSNRKRELFYDKLRSLLDEIEFLDTPQPERSWSSVRDIFDRASMDQKDFNILMGMVKTLGRKIEKSE